MLRLLDKHEATSGAAMPEKRFDEDASNDGDKTIHGIAVVNDQLKRLEGVVTRIDQNINLYFHGSAGNPGLVVRVDRLEGAMDRFNANSARIERVEDRLDKLDREDVAMLKRSEAERTKRMDRLQTMVYGVAGSVLVAMILAAVAYFTK